MSVKIKTVQITKVNIALYEKPIKQLLRQKKYSIKFYEEMIELFTKFLHCSECEEVLPKEKFSKSGQFSNRGGHYPKCKMCAKKLYDTDKKFQPVKIRKIVAKKKQ